MSHILKDDQVFVCPECGSTCHSPIITIGNPLTRRSCNGCDYSWHPARDKDHLYEKVDPAGKKTGPFGEIA